MQQLDPLRQERVEGNLSGFGADFPAVNVISDDRRCLKNQVAGCDDFNILS
jgi:hypothetical protein